MPLSNQQRDALRGVLEAITNVWDRGRDAEELFPGREIVTCSEAIYELAAFREDATDADLVAAFGLEE